MKRFQQMRIKTKTTMACKRSRFCLLLAACGIVCLAAGGCGPKRPETFPVSGRVTYKGQPVARGLVAFYPAEGRMATGDIGPDGRYSLTTFHAGEAPCRAATA